MIHPSKRDDEDTTTRYTQRVSTPHSSPKIEAWARHMLYLRAARTFIEACDAEGIPVLPVKGIVSAYTLYGDPAERPMLDVDFRVRLVDIPRVGDLARKRAWHVVNTSRAYASFAFSFEGGVEVDVEGSVGPPHICRLTVDEVLERSLPSSALGFSCRFPELHDHAVLLVVNAFKDKLDRSRAWAARDLVAIAREPAFDAELLVRRLREARVATIGAIVAAWLVEEHEAAAWSPVRDALSRHAHKLYVRSFNYARRWPDALPMRVLARLSADRPLDSARALGRAVWWELEQSLGAQRHNSV